MLGYLKSIGLNVVCLIILILVGCSEASTPTIVPTLPPTMTIMPTPVPTATWTLTPTALPTPTPTATPTLSAMQRKEIEEYAVYSAVVGNELGGYNTSRLIVIRENTLPRFPALDSGLVKIQKESTWLTLELLDEFTAVWKNQKKLTRRLTVSQEYIILGENDFNTLFRAGIDGWKDYYQNYPNSGGYMMLSPVAFDTTMNKAILIVGVQCGPTCGFGALAYLEKENGIWNIKKGTNLWIS